MNADEIRRLLALGDAELLRVGHARGHILSLLGVIEQMSEALDIARKCSYPVSADISPRGYNWSEAYLDQALPIIEDAYAASADYVALAREQGKG